MGIGVQVNDFDKFIAQSDVLCVVTCIVTLMGAICSSHVVRCYVFPFFGNKIEFIRKRNEDIVSK